MKKSPVFPSVLLSLLLTLALLTGCAPEPLPTYDLENVPAFSGEPFVVLSDNLPDFPEEDKTSVSFEEYAPLDLLGRCGPAYANVGPETMPTEERGSISSVKPTGWQSVKYDFVDGKSLYNRCHLLGFQLTGENANERNLITGTRFLNVEGMLPFENLIADYVYETGNHVLYRVTPVFEGLELVARGVRMEGWSVEDGGEGICFHVYAYNNQPGVVLDYATGLSWAEGEDPPARETGGGDDAVEADYVLNQKSRVFHLPTCSGAASMSEANRQDYHGSREELLAEGYKPCGQCKP